MVRVDIGDGLKEYSAVIDLKAPELDDHEGFGVANYFPAGASDKKNCNGVKFAYVKVEIDYRTIFLQSVSDVDSYQNIPPTELNGLDVLRRRFSDKDKYYR